ncbi:MAG: hypothetical protein QOE60_25 [Thermoleophilaceae bacterium]|nr:hypothetical protein [Thermoleophilaceae bacterium]
MQEITPGIHHWTAVHPNIGWVVSSYWLPQLKVLVDPLEVPEEVEGVEEIVLSNRHHKRSAFEARERFGAVLRVPRVGLHEFDESDPVEPYDFGSPLVGGTITPHQVTKLWPDDAALHVPSLEALAIADTVLSNEGRLAFMPDECFDDREVEQGSIRAGLARLADELEFRHLLLAHGTPLIGDGRERLREFAAA